MRQVISCPTRVTDTTSTLIDWYLTNSITTEANVHSNFNISDHNFITINLFPRKKKQPERRMKIVTDWKNYSKAALKGELSKVEWIEYDKSVDINAKSNFLFNNLTKIVSNLLTVKNVHESNNLKWYNHDLKSLKYDKIEAKKTFDISKSHDDWIIYSKFRNKYNKALVSAESCYIQDQLD